MKDGRDHGVLLVMANDMKHSMANDSMANDSMANNTDHYGHHEG